MSTWHSGLVEEVIELMSTWHSGPVWGGYTDNVNMALGSDRGGYTGDANIANIKSRSCGRNKHEGNVAVFPKEPLLL